MRSPRTTAALRLVPVLAAEPGDADLGLAVTIGLARPVGRPASAVRG